MDRHACRFLPAMALRATFAKRFEPGEAGREAACCGECRDARPGRTPAPREIEGDGEAAAAQALVGSLGPLHQGESALRQFFKAELAEIVGSGEPVEVGVEDASARRIVHLHHRKGRARDFISRLPVSLRTMARASSVLPTPRPPENVTRSPGRNSSAIRAARRLVAPMSGREIVQDGEADATRTSPEAGREKPSAIAYTGYSAASLTRAPSAGKTQVTVVPSPCSGDQADVATWPVRDDLFGGTGFEKRKPCPSWGLLVRAGSSSSSGVSIPSATTRNPARGRVRGPRRDARPLLLRDGLMNARSIFSSSTGSSRSFASDEYPVPKSSMAMRRPPRCRSHKISWARSGSIIAELSSDLDQHVRPGSMPPSTMRLQDALGEIGLPELPRREIEADLEADVELTPGLGLIDELAHHPVSDQLDEIRVLPRAG